MAQKMTGALVFDERTDRYDIRFDLNSYYGGLHCGECFDVFVRGKWKPTRIEYGDNWYLVGNGNCILLDDGDECVCPQLISYSLLCKWFRVAVLPADRLLYAELYQTGDKKKCTECGAFFASTSNSVKYCPVCRKRITRRQAAERMRKRRAPVTQ